MREKNTGDLNEELMAQADLDAYLSDNQALFAGTELPSILTGLYQRSRLSKADLARRAGMSEVYLHQVFSGRRTPSRDRLLCICVVLEVPLEEIQNLLKRNGYAQLYPKLKRDAVVIHGIVHGTPIEGINNKLFAENEKTLF